MADAEKTVRESNRFREGREAAGLTVSEAARSIGVAPMTLRGWEAGTQTPRDAVRLRNMCVAYDANADWLLGLA